MTETTTFSREAEEAVIGSVLIDSDLFSSMPFGPEGEEFQSMKIRFLWQTINALYRAGQPVDYLTICEHMEGRKATIGEYRNLLEEIGGPAYVMSLINRSVSSMNADAYARIVLDHYDRRKLLRVIEQIARDAQNPEFSVVDVISRANMALSQTVRVEGDLHHWSEDIRSVIDYVEKRVRNPAPIWGIPTGIPSFDEATGGLQRGWFILLQGAPGVGKSRIFRQILRQVASAQGYPAEMQSTAPKHHNVAAFSLEMSDEFVTMRDLSAASDVPTRGLHTGDLESWQLTHFLQTADHAAGLSIYQTDRAKWTPAEMRASIARLKAKLEAKGETLDLVGIDYLFLMVPGIKGDMKDYEKAEYLSTDMKAWAREFNVPIIAINSLTKDGFDEGRPGMGSGRGGAQLFHNCDVVGNLTKMTEREHGPKFPKHIMDRCITFWFTKGRELEEADGHFDLIGGDGSPWLIDAMADPEYAAVVNAYNEAQQRQKAAVAATVDQYAKGKNGKYSAV